MKKKTDYTGKSNPVVTTAVTAFFDLAKHFISDLDNRSKVSKIDKYTEAIQNMEHLIVRLEDKFEQQRKEIEDLKNRLMWGNIIIVVLLLINLYHLIMVG